jgi:hypothetical protein
MSNKTAVATVPSSVTVATGAMGASFTVRTQPVSSYTLVDLAASDGGQNQFAEFSVRPS